ncbi:MAG: hypothetical protein J6X42_02845, partial [Alphaproteobacteria bacterium]|nr:hypothetical protein [Alphaproteobacteria bacterium]
MKKSVILTFALLCGACLEAKATTILEAMGDAYQHNPTLEGERANLRAVDENVAIAKSGYRPTV